MLRAHVIGVVALTATVALAACRNQGAPPQSPAERSAADVLLG